VALRSVNVDSCLQQMMNVKWDIKEIMSQHSGYVDSLLHVCFLCTSFIYLMTVTQERRLQQQLIIYLFLILFCFGENFVAVYLFLFEILRD